jgi:hypothetical protein
VPNALLLIIGSNLLPPPIFPSCSFLLLPCSFLAPFFLPPYKVLLFLRADFPDTCRNAVWEGLEADAAVRINRLFNMVNRLLRCGRGSKQTPLYVWKHIQMVFKGDLIDDLCPRGRPCTQLDTLYTILYTTGYTVHNWIHCTQLGTHPSQPSRYKLNHTCVISSIPYSPSQHYLIYIYILHPHTCVISSIPYSPSQHYLTLTPTSVPNCSLMNPFLSIRY